MQLLSSSNGRHFRDDEIERIQHYAESLPDRLTAVKEVADHRDFLTKHLSKNVPEFSGNQPFAADLVDSMQAICQAMLLDDLSVVENKLQDRLYSVVVLMEMPAATLMDCYQQLENTLYSKSSPASKELLEPYFQWARERMLTMVEEPEYAT
ncbi:MAG TPA: hypothetical protein PKD72_15395, partial [Gemmatales bacterium]|nr:hypothetical protein [Gemmatales bacterium]